MKELERVKKEIKEFETSEVIKRIKYRLINFKLHYLEKEELEEILGELEIEESDKRMKTFKNLKLVKVSKEKDKMTKQELIKEIQKMIDNEVYSLNQRLQHSGFKDKYGELNSAGWKVRIDGDNFISKMREILRLVKETQ